MKSGNNKSCKSLIASVVLLLVSLLTLISPGSSFALVGKPMIVYSEEGQTAVKYSTYSSGACATGATLATVTNIQYCKAGKTIPGGIGIRIARRNLFLLSQEHGFSDFLAK